MIKILVVEDQTLVKNALATLLSLEPDFEVVAQAEDGEKALNLLVDCQVDLVLSDIEMPNLNGIELSEIIKKKYPKIRIVIMTTFSRAGYIQRCLKLGVDGFILKEASSDYLTNSINKVVQGKRIIDPELALMALDDNDPLSAKERKALKLAGEGLKTSEIAAKLFLSEGTIRNYLSEAISKLNATNRIDAARIARQKGWL